jgi:large subunit ribosomal protein L4
VLAGLTDRTKLLVVLERTDIGRLKSRAQPRLVHVLAVDQLNTYDVLCADDVVFTRCARHLASSLVPVAATVEGRRG